MACLCLPATRMRHCGKGLDTQEKPTEHVLADRDVLDEEADQGQADPTKAEADT